MKKKILISFLIVSFFNYIGCYSYYTLSEEEISSGNLSTDKDLKFMLKDNTEIEFESLANHISSGYYYLKVDKPSRILIGSGDKIDKNTRLKSSFEGILKDEMIDSTRIFIVDSEEYSVYWTKDNNRLSFKKGNYLDITPDQGTGYYICKSYELVRKISFNDIKEIQARSRNWYVTVSLGILCLAAVIVICWGASRFPSSLPK